MAGSYRHCVDDNGKLLPPEKLSGRIERSTGDVYEAVEEMYGMIWFLAQGWVLATDAPSTQAVIEKAEEYYKDGLKLAGVKPWDE